MSERDTSGTDHAERPDPEDDPFACNICGAAIGELERIQGEGYCESCKREYGPDEYATDGGHPECQVPGCSTEPADGSEICTDCNDALQRQLELGDADRHRGRRYR